MEMMWHPFVTYLKGALNRGRYTLVPCPILDESWCENEEEKMKKSLEKDKEKEKEKWKGKKERKRKA